MGPRAFAHGDVVRMSRTLCLKWSLQWGRGLSPTETWKDTSPDLDNCELQWGRGLSPTETNSPSPGAAEYSTASMGPRAFAHGDFLPVLPLFLFRRCFNGAAGFRPRRRADPKTRAPGIGRLQWGRGLSPTETFAADFPTFPELVASMGPRAFAHGDPAGL